MVKTYAADIIQALKCEAYYSALALSLAIPDIFGFLDNGPIDSRTRYYDWFDKWCQGISPWLSAHDCYKLRCAYLHSGEDELGGKALIQTITFSKPASGNVKKFQHGDGPGSQKSRIPIDQFCVGMCDAIEAWETERGSDARVLKRMQSLARVRAPDESF